MRNLLTLTIVLLLGVASYAQSDMEALFKLPEVDVKTVNGEPFNTKDIQNDGKPIIVTFWATWCKPCMKEHDAINDIYEEWVDETGVKLYAISIDNARSSKRVLPTVDGKGWEFDVLLDPNGDFKRAMNVNMIPHTFLIDGEGNIVWSHTSFSEGSELQLIQKVREVAEGKTVSDH